MEKNFKIYDEALTNEAKNIFGDIVDKAYIAVCYFGREYDDPDVRFKFELKNNSTTIKPNDICLGSDDIIIIDFVNGKSVSFCSTDCAWIENTEKNYEEK